MVFSASCLSTLLPASLQIGSHGSHCPLALTMMSMPERLAYKSQDPRIYLPQDQQHALQELLLGQHPLLHGLTSHVIILHQPTCNYGFAFFQVVQMYGTAPSLQRLDTVLQDGGSVYDFARTQSIILQDVSNAATAGDGCAPDDPIYAPAPTAPPPTLKFLTWNVRGLKSRALHVTNMLASCAPTVAVFTETKLTVSSSRMPWLQACFQGYKIHVSSKSSQSASAGVVMAIQSDFAPFTCFHNAPEHLQGYFTHLEISLPDSLPLHVIGVYQETAHPLAIPVQISIFEYISTLSSRTDISLLIGGDFNAVNQPCDRNPIPEHPSPLDRGFQDYLFTLSLQSAFPPAEVRRPMSFQQDSARGSASRIDDWLSPQVCPHLALPVPQILPTQFSDGSDHAPILLTTLHARYFLATLPQQSPMPTPSPNFRLPLLPSHIVQWQQQAMTDYCDIARIAIRAMHTRLFGRHPYYTH